MDNKLDINVTEKKVSDENLLKTVEEALIKMNSAYLWVKRVLLWLQEHRTTQKKSFEIAKCFACRLFEHGKATDYDIEQILLLQLEAVKEIKKSFQELPPERKYTA